jgi:hypothetical protein
MEASRRQPGMLEGLSRFLIQHERCGAGFDVAHPAGLGSGRVSITCRGCGARHEYATATIEFERELKIEPAQPPGRPPAPPSPPRRAAPIPPRPAPYPDATQPAPPTPEPEPPRPSQRPAPAQRPAAASAPAAGARTRRPTPRPAISAPPGPTPMRRLGNALRSPQSTVVLLVIAAVALGFGVVRLVNGNGSGHHATTAAPPPASTTPTLPTTTTVAPPASTPPAQTGNLPGVGQPATTRLETQRFSIDVPRGWTQHTSTGGLLLQPPGGGRVNVQIFFQRSPGLGPAEMGTQTAAFLRRQVPGAALFPRQVRIAGRPAREITARGPGETAIAVDVLRGPYRYLLVQRIFAGAQPHTTVAANRVVMSFRPR